MNKGGNRSGYFALYPLACEEFIDILKPESPIVAVANSVGFEQSVITPRSDCVGMHMEKFGYLRDR